MVSSRKTLQVDTFTDYHPAQTESKGDTGFETAGADDFLSREKALLGDDADQFTTGNDAAAFVEDGDDDLLGGGGGEEITEFESSFPDINTRNEVCTTTFNTIGSSSLMD